MVRRTTLAFILGSHTHVFFVMGTQYQAEVIDLSEYCGLKHSTQIFPNVFSSWHFIYTFSEPFLF